ncbi:hypothetical protein [Streptomyces uncialis]|uniref:hypothetical protein n=1 Tax=Streptomyces uncialis TaxID=1048205 RepID=UPI0033F2C213
MAVPGPGRGPAAGRRVQRLQAAVDASLGGEGLDSIALDVARWGPALVQAKDGDAGAADGSSTASSRPR